MPLLSPVQSVIDFGRAFVGERPVYSAGRKIGYISYKGRSVDDAAREACNGTIVVYEGEQRGDPAFWYTIDPNDFLGIKKIPVSAFCTRYGIIPSWATEPQKTGAVKDPATGVITLPNPDGSVGVLPDLSEDERKKLLLMASVGGFGLLAVLILLRR
jgi:hypothetical protein